MGVCAVVVPYSSIFQVRLRNYRGAAVELYRLCKRLDGGTAFEDDPNRLHKKTDALAQVGRSIDRCVGWGRGCGKGSDSQSTELPWWVG